MTNFPETLEIHIIDSRDRKPIEGIILLIHLFANRKNDYWLFSDYSDKNGLVVITKQMMRNEITEASNMYIMDYASNLEDSKPYIELMAEDGPKIEKRMNGIKGSWAIHSEKGLWYYNQLKMCNNRLISYESKIIDIEQDAEKQEITFEVTLINPRKALG